MSVTASWRGRALAGLALAIVGVGGGVGGAGGAATPNPLNWNGVYKTRFDNALTSGERYRSENILEIVGYSPTASYVRLHLEFANGHQCALSGVAEAVGPALVYRTVVERGDRPCVLTLRAQGGKLMLDDADGVCREQSCGARGLYTGVSFPVAGRRPIRYLLRLKASAQYQAAVAAFKLRPRAPG